MFSYTKIIVRNLLKSLKSKHKWLILLFAIWLFRVEFIPDTEGGIAKALQIGTLGLITILLLKYKSCIISYSFNKTNLPIKSILWLYVFAFISTAWSIMPQFSFFLSFQNLLFIMMAVWLFSLANTFKSTERLFLTVLIGIGMLQTIGLRLAIQHVLIAHFLPGGSLAAVCLTYCIGELLTIQKRDRERRAFLKHSACLSVLLLIINTSGGANASAVCGIAIAMFLGNKKIYAFILMIIAIFIYANQDLIENILLTLMPDKNIEQIESGNGREYIWERLLMYADQKPLCGWGFACIERVDQDIFDGQSLSDAHNNYIGIYGSLGIIGCLLYGLHIISTGFYILKRKQSVGFAGLFCAFVCLCANSYTYGFLSGKTCSITIVYFIIVVLTYFYNRNTVYDYPRIKQ